MKKIFFKYIKFVFIFLFLASCGKNDGVAPSLEPSLSGIAISPSAITLAANNNVTFTASGGSGSYSYSIFSGSGSVLLATGAFTAPSSAGTTVVRVVDGQGHFADAIVTINPALLISPSSVSLGLSQAQTFSTSGGVPPITYSIASGLGSINSSSGAYTAGNSSGSAVVRATDSLGNTSDSNITIFGSLGLTPTTIDVAVNNTINFSAAGGVGPYTYSVFSGSGVINASTGVFTAAASSGSATVRVTDSLGHTADSFVTVNAALAISPTSQILNIGDSLTFAAIDGVPPYTFSIFSGTGTIDAAGGVYTAPGISGAAVIQLMDSYGNSLTANVTITSPLSVSPSSKIMAVSNAFSFTGVGGSTPYSYSVVSGGGSVNAAGVFTAGVTSGTSIVRVTDSLGATANANITVNDALSIAPSAPTTTAATGSIFFSAAGGVMPYTFAVSSGLGTINSSTGAYTAPVAAGTDVITVTDAFGNSVSANVTINTDLGVNPAGVTVVANTNYSFAALNGTAPYTWSIVSGGGSINASGVFTAPATAGTTVIRVSDSGGAQADANITIRPVLQISPTTKTLAVNNLQSFTASGGISPYTFSVFAGSGTIDSSTGVYTAPAVSGSATVRVTDANSNTSDATITINPALAISPSAATITTIDSKTFTASGGVAPYTYSVCSGDGSITGGGVYSGGSVGNKTIRVTDSLGNTSDAILTVNTILAITPTSVYVQVDSDIQFSTTGGVAPMTYSITAGSGSIDSALGVFTAPSTTGSTTVRVTDALGHTSSTSSITIYNPLTISPLSVTLGINTTQTFTATGGVGALTFAMYSGLGSVDANTGLYTASATAGTEQIKVTDTIGNTAIATAYVVSQLTISPTSLLLPVFSTATFSAVLGTAPYSYSVFSGSGSINSATGVYTAASSIGAGTARVTDANSNTSDASITHIKPVELSSGAYHTCARYNEGSVKCWGDNGFGQLGQGSTADLGDTANEGGGYLPFVNLGTGRTATKVVSGNYHNCALLDNGQVKCWGYNVNGQLGRGNTANIGDNPGEMGDSLQAVNLGTGRTATQIFADAYITCAILDNATTKCWGRNTYGQLGLGDANHRGDAANEMGDNLPIINFGTGRTATKLAGGFEFTCAILDNGSVKCFGRSFYGQLGQGNANTLGDGAGEMGDSLAAVNLGTGRTAVDIAAGYYHVCALLDDSTMKCWGRSRYGELGKGNTSSLGDGAGEMGDSLTAISLGTGFTPASIYVGRYLSCAISVAGVTKCWGLNTSGQLMKGNTNNLGDGGGEMGDSLTAINFGTGFTLSQLSTNWYGGCLITSTDRVKCWGSALNGGLLNTSTTQHLGDAGSELGDSLPFVNH